MNDMYKNIKNSYFITNSGITNFPHEYEISELPVEESIYISLGAENRIYDQIHQPIETYMQNYEYGCFKMEGLNGIY